jgi:hypothetical protein
VEQPADYRAALHDVIARAGKRAFVQAVLYATATDELFMVADDPGEGARLRAEAAAAGRLPKNAFGKYAGQLVADVPTEELAAIAQWCRHASPNAAVASPSGFMQRTCAAAGPAERTRTTWCRSVPCITPNSIRSERRRSSGVWA